MRLLVCLVAAVILSGCAGSMLPGSMHVSPDNKVMEFGIERSSGSGKMYALDKETGERFFGTYFAHHSGSQKARGEGVLVGATGKKIKLRFLIEPGIRPTGRGVGSDEAGARYDVIF